MGRKKQKKLKREGEEGHLAIAEPGAATGNAVPGPVARPASPLPDHTDHIIEAWARERPDLDVSPVGVINRLGRLMSFLRPEIEEVHERYGLTNASFSVLAALRRAGEPYRLSQRSLMDALQLTSGTISVRIDRLVQDGLVERSPDPGDQRGVLVSLTPRGSKLFDRVAPVHLANEDRLLSALGAAQREQLAALLRILLLSFEKPAPGDPGHPCNRIGAALAPAHVARQIRSSVGLVDLPGLLVQDVEPGGTAAEAGVQAGDLLLAADGVELRSINCLYEQLETWSERPIDLEVQRGGKRLTVQLAREAVTGDQPLV